MIWLLVCSVARAQNLVPNGSFEQSVGCPNNVTGCTNWGPYGSLYCAYMKSCGTPGTSGVPSNTFGYQQAAEGYSYMALYDYTKSQPDAKEYILSTLKQPMQVGITYEVSMSVSLSDNSAFAGNDLAIHLFKSGPVYYTQYTVLSQVSPKIPFTNYGAIKDKTNWVRLFKIFVADSAYDHIAIGGFSQYNNMGLDSVAPGNYGLYYIDSVVVRQVRMQVQFIDTIHCSGDSISVAYTTFSNSGFQPGNVFNLYLSDGNGDFSNSTLLATTSATAGTLRVRIPPSSLSGDKYRLKLYSTMPVDSSADNGYNIHIYSPPDAKIYTNSPVCQGDTLVFHGISNKPVDATNGYTWFGYGMGGGTSANPLRIYDVTLAHAGTYYLRATYHGCISWDTAVVQISPSPQNVKATNNGPVCEGETLNLNGSSPSSGLTFNWTSKNAFNSSAKDVQLPQLKYADTGMYYFTATQGGCSVTDSTYVGIKPLPSPNITTSAALCAGDSLLLQSSETVSGETYQWTGPNSFTATGKTAIIYNAGTAASGKYSVVVTADGCVGTDTASVTIKPLPPKPVAKSNSPVCAGDTLDLYTENPLPGVLYTWSNDLFSVEDTFIQIISPEPDQSGIYVLTAGSNGCFASDSVDALIKQLPLEPVVTSNAPLQTPQNLQLTLKNFQTGVKYLWTGPKGFMSQLPSPSIYSPGTDYTGLFQIVANLDGCTSSSQIFIRIDASVDTGYIYLLPTFNDGNFKIAAILHSDQQVRINIYDAAGREVFSGFAKTIDRKLDVEFPLKNYLSSGDYIVHLIADDKKHVLRFVVQR